MTDKTTRAPRRGLATSTVDSAPRFTHRSLLSRMPFRSKAALAVLAAIVVLIVAAPVLPLADPLKGVLADRLRSFGEDGFVLGSDALGRDVFSRLVYATRTSIIAGVVPIIISATIGLAIGLVAGLAGKVVNTVLMRAVDLLFAFPGVLLSLLLAITFGQGLGTLILALTFVWIAPVARIAETEVVRIRDLDFVTAARSSGAGYASILLRQILPVSLPAVIAYSTSLVGANIAIAGGLGFLGLGVPSPTPELGSMLQELQVTIYSDPALALTPVVVILLLSTLFPLLGDGLREAINGRGED
jgi:peptide/nickel transport system permease protein